MVGKRLAPPTEEGLRREMRNYGTMESNNSSTSEPPGSCREPEDQAVAGDLSFGFVMCYYMVMMIPLITLAIWCLYNTGNETAVLLSPSPPHHQSHTWQDPDYLWLVEHDRHAYNETFATLKSLYMVDRRLTNASGGCTSTTATWTWNLDRASYAGVALEDLSRIPGRYQAVMGADMVFCEWAGPGSVPASQTRECRVVGNSYFAQHANRLQWPSLRVFDVAENFSLAFRPSFEGEHRANPCICQATDTGTAHVIVNTRKSAHLLIVECSNSPLFEPQSPVQWGDDGASKSTTTMAPNLYVKRDEHGPRFHNGAVHNPVELEDTTKGRDPASRSVAPRVATRAHGSPRYLDGHIICTLCRCIWSRCCRSYFRRSESAVLSTGSPSGILPTEVSQDKPIKQNFSGVFVAIGVLALLSTIAFATWAVQRIRKQRRQPTTEKAESRGALPGLEPGYVSEHTIPEEVEDNLAAEIDRRPWYVCLRQRAQRVWPKWLPNVFTLTEPHVSELNEAEKGNSPRRLEKKKDTRVGDPTGQRVHIVEPVSGMSVNGASGGLWNSATGTHDGVENNVRQGSVEQVGSSSTAQNHGSRAGATRRSNLSSAVQDEHAENP